MLQKTSEKVPGIVMGKHRVMHFLNQETLWTKFFKIVDVSHMGRVWDSPALPKPTFRT